MHTCLKKGSLFLVPTPIGNFQDITLRALEVLKTVPILFCEDTRKTTYLLQKLHIPVPQLYAYHDHSPSGVRDKILMYLDQGDVAYVSDGGTPLICDPGFKLVSECQKKGFHVVSLPGPCALITALTLSGMAPYPFTFKGFFPKKAMEKKKTITSLEADMTYVFYESPRRLCATLEAFQSSLSDAQCAVIREMTKTHEEVVQGKPGDLHKHFTENKPKGEIVFIIRRQSKQPSPESIDSMIHELLDTCSLKEAVMIMKEKYDLSKKVLYQKALEIQEKKHLS